MLSEKKKSITKALEKVLPVVNDFQREILDECMLKGSGGLSLPMGSGKTLISLILALKTIKKSKDFENPALIVMSKSLLSSWEFEIKKFFKDTLKYEVLYKDVENFRIKDDTIVLLTTIDTVSSCYKRNDISEKFITVDEELTEVEFYYRNVYSNTYNNPRTPFIKKNELNDGTMYLFSTKFSCFIVDEVQKFTNIVSQRCQSLCSICSDNRWCLSGTMFDEPKPERILGYYVILNHPTFPRSVPAAKKAISNPRYKGLIETLVKREKNIEFIEPKINKIVISHDLSKEEIMLYMMMKETLSALQKKIKTFKSQNDKEGVKRFSSYLLVMLVYLRQSIVCPLIPISSISLDITEYKSKSELSKILHSKFTNMGLEKWLEDPNSIKSSRIKEVLKVLEKHNDEKVVIFTCFTTSVNVINHFIKDRKVLLLTADMSIKKRGEVVEEFKNEKSKNPVLFLTYELGAEGLNLQCSHTILIVDFWWNSGKTNQAVARVLRFGQMSEFVNVYFFTGNTGIEKAIFTKQQEKMTVLDELQNGPKKTVIKTIKMQDVLKLIELNENKDLLGSVINHKKIETNVDELVEKMNELKI